MEGGEDEEEGAMTNESASEHIEDEEVILGEEKIEVEET